jgi:hypothetical protein
MRQNPIVVSPQIEFIIHETNERSNTTIKFRYYGINSSPVSVGLSSFRTKLLFIKQYLKDFHLTIQSNLTSQLPASTLNMKIDTKKCITISKSTPKVLIRPNKYIFENYKDNDREQPSSPEKGKDETSFGRNVNYEPLLIVSKTLKSSRLSHTKENRSVDEDGLESLMFNMEKMFIKADEEEKGPESLMINMGKLFNKGDEEEKVEEKKEQELVEKEEGRNERESIVSPEEEFTPVLGRVYKSRLSYRTYKTYQVRRSPRLAD